MLASLERQSSDRRSRAACRPTNPPRRSTPTHRATDTYPLPLNDLTNIYIFSAPWLIGNNATLPTDAGKGIEGYLTNV